MRGRVVAFSLVELLVMITIMSVLAAMLLPALERSIWQARMTACAGNLRQQGYAFTSYANDNRGAWPYRRFGGNVDGSSTGIQTDPPYWTLGIPRYLSDRRGLIVPYLEPGPVYACPLLDRDWRKFWTTPDSANYLLNVHVWPGYAVFAGCANPDTTRQPVIPETRATVSTGTIEQRWRLVSAVRDGDYPNRPILGDALYYRIRSGPMTCFILQNAVNSYSSPHIPGEFEYGTCGSRVSAGSVPPVNACYSDLSVLARTEDFVAYYDYVNNDYLFWHLKN